MRIAVTGTSGRVGGAVAAQLTERGHSVVGLDLAEPSRRVGGVDYIVGDVAELERGDPRLADVEAVVHLGALMSWDPAEAERLHEANVTATLRLIRALEGGSVRRFVLASTGEVYPENSPRYQPLNEDHPRLPRTWYGLTKVLAEETVAFAGRANGWDTVALRFSHTQHPSELLDPDSFFSGPRFFAGRRHRKELAAGNDAVATQLAGHADDDTLLVARREDGAPVRMGILATQDLARGVVLAAEAHTTGHEVIGLGPDDSIDLGDFALALAEAAAMATVEVVLPTTAPSYVTSNDRARELLGFEPRIGPQEMIRQAVEARRARLRG